MFILSGGYGEQNIFARFTDKFLVTEWELKIICWQFVQLFVSFTTTIILSVDYTAKDVDLTPLKRLHRCDLSFDCEDSLLCTDESKT